MITSTIFQDLTQRFERLINICKGWEIPLKKFYETKTGQKDIPVLAQALTDRLSSELAGYKQFYYHFFLMTLAYLESTCNLEDKIFLSIKILSQTIDRSGNDQSTFEIMMDKAEGFPKNKLETAFWEICKNEFAMFYADYCAFFQSNTFSDNVQKCVEAFLADNGMCLSAEEISDSMIPDLLDDTLHRIKHEYLKVTDKKIENENENRL